MNVKFNFPIRIFIFFLSFFLLFSSHALYAQFEFESNGKGNGTVELNGDVVEYSVDQSKVTAKGNVVIIYQGATLTCDQVEFYRNTQIAHAQGNVRLSSSTAQIYGDRLTFNFGTMSGEFQKAKIMSYPYYGYGKTIKRIDEKHVVMTDGWMSTSDYDKPEYRLTSKKIDIYPGDKLVARNVRVLVGNLPVMYWPRLTRDITGREPLVQYTPGYDSYFSPFLLSKWRYRLSERVAGYVNLDYRDNLGFAWGIDTKYETKNFGKGIIRTYYTGEHNKQGLVDNVSPHTIQRFRGEWRHKWKIDEKTDAIWQYYKVSDRNFLRQYFEKEYDQDFSPDTFFLLTRLLPKGILSLRVDSRVNRFESGVEKLPELRYDLSNEKLGDTNFYFKNQTTFSNLAKEDANPNNTRLKTMRLDIDNELSYVKKLGIIEFKPFVGGRHTYYSRTINPDRYNTIR